MRPIGAIVHGAATQTVSWLDSVPVRVAIAAYRIPAVAIGASRIAAALAVSMTSTQWRFPAKPRFVGPTG